MGERDNKSTVCRNGHQQQSSGSKFCIYCGTALNNTAAQPTSPVPAAPPSPPSPHHFQSPPSQNFPQQPTPPIYHQSPDQSRQTPPNCNQAPAPVGKSLNCYACGGNGRNLSGKAVICKECRWLRPLIPGYQVEVSAFHWAADGKAMAALRSVKTLNAAAQAVSEKVGRRWIESTFNGVRLSERQMPQIYAQAVKAARILGMSHMPDVYLSGERAWDCLTFGSDRDSFIVIGSALAGSFQGADMLFLLAREMGHCRAGHALWKTVIRFLLGEQGQSKGFMAGGVFNAILSPSALIGGAIEMPLLAWARQAEITADRAGLLTVGSEDIARRVLLSWSLKSSFLCRQINIEAWLEQQSATDEDGYTKLSELTTTSTPYLAPRLKLLTEFARSRELHYWREAIAGATKKAAPKVPDKPAEPAAKLDVIRLKCAACQTPMRIPVNVLAGKKELPVKCPNAECGKITRLKKNVKPAGKASNAQPPNRMKENMNYGE